MRWIARWPRSASTRSPCTLTPWRDWVLCAGVIGQQGAFAGRGSQTGVLSWCVRKMFRVNSRVSVMQIGAFGLRMGVISGFRLVV